MMNPSSDALTHSPQQDVARARLSRLEKYLEADPENDALMADAFETALRCGEWPRAEFQLTHARKLDPTSLHWALREADLFLAQERFDRAREVLAQLVALPSRPPALADAILHNLAYISFAQGRYDECVAQLEERLEIRLDNEKSFDSAVPGAESLSVLWLRALHRVGELDRAMEWLMAMERSDQLLPATAGIASLIALDADEMAASARWLSFETRSASAERRTLEAWVAQSSLALADQDAVGAKAAAEAALKLNPTDGRSLSAMAFAELLVGNASAAIHQFALALMSMPKHVGTWHGQAWAQLLQGDVAAAQKSFESALLLDRNFAESHGGLAVTLALRGEQQAALVEIELASRLDPANLSGRYAEAVLSGEVMDPVLFSKLTHRLLGRLSGPLGGTMLGAVSKAVEARSST